MEGEFGKEGLRLGHELLRFMVVGQLALVDEDYFDKAIDGLLAALLNAKQGTNYLLISLEFLFLLLEVLCPTPAGDRLLSGARTRTRATPVLL
jgi:hypothetical protein